MASFVPEEDDASFSVVGSNYNLVANFSSTLDNAFIKMYATDDSLLGYSLGVSNISTTTPSFILGKVLSNTTIPSKDITLCNGKFGVSVSNVPEFTVDINGDINMNGTLYNHKIPMLYFAASNIGIGSTTPVVALDVVGAIRTTSTLTASNLELLGTSVTFAAVNSSNIIINNTQFAGPALTVTQKTVGGNGVLAEFYDVDVSTSVPVLKVGDNARVGINTTASSEALTVVGNISSTGRIISSIATGTSPFQVSSTTTVTNLSAEYLSGLTANYFLNATNLNTGTINQLRLPNTGIAAATYGNASNVPAFTVDSTGRLSNVTLQPIKIAYTDVSGIASVASSGNYNDLSNKTFVLSGSNAVFQSGNVGIGFASPSVNLHVASASGDTLMRLSGPNAATNVIGVEMVERESPLLGSRIVYNPLDERVYFQALKSGVIDTNVSVDQTSGNVGIGTLNASSKLHVVGDAWFSETLRASNLNADDILSGTLSAARLPSSSVTVGTYGLSNLIPRITVDTYGRITNATESSISILRSSITDLVDPWVKNTESHIYYTLGNVGVGTTSANSTLHVQGNTLVAGNITPSQDSAFDLGSSGARFRDLFLSGTSIDLGGTRITAASNTLKFLAPSSTLYMNTWVNDMNAQGNAYITGSISAANLVASAFTNTTNATNISSGTLSAERLPTSGVTASIYGTSTEVPRITVDSYGRITAAQNQSIAINVSAVNGLAASATTDTTIASNITKGVLNTSIFPSSGVTPNTYGKSNVVPVINVDIYGRITSVVDTNILISSTAVTGLAGSATTDTTNAANISSGTLNASRLPTSGVTAGTYGSASSVSVVNVDTTGRVTSASSQQIGIGATQVSGLATVATSGNYNDLTNRTFVRNGSEAIYSLGNVGIGYENPAYKLAVNGSIYANGTLYASNINITGDFTVLNTTTSNTDQFLIDNNGTGPAFQTIQRGPQPVAFFYDDANIALAIIDGGNVGIATTNPAYPLEVYGTMNVNGSIYQNGAPLITGTNANNITTGTLNVSRLPLSGVTASTYGSTSAVPVISVDEYGRITSASSQSIAISTSAVSGLAASATVDATNATNISSGTFNVARLPSSGVLAGSYGNSNTIPCINVDQYGRITSVLTSNLSSVAVSGNYNDLSNKTFVLNNTNAVYTDGNVGIGTNAPTTKLEVNGTVKAVQFVGDGSLLTGVVTAATASTQWSDYVVGSSSNIYYTTGKVGIGTTVPNYPLHVEGDIFGTNVITYSDFRMKKDVATIEDALSKITNIRGVTYRLLNDERTYMGVVAQEVEPYIPEVVQTDANGMKSVSYGNIVGICIEAIKDLKKIIQTQQGEIDALKLALQPN
jgi:hypothetical protein